jgi:hypothetical protein
MIRFLRWTAPLLIVATPAFAQSASTDTLTASADAGGKSKKICRKFAVTGQRIAKSVCNTAAQWAELDGKNEQNAKDFVNGVQTSGARANLSGGGTSGLSTAPLFGLGQ